MSDAQNPFFAPSTAPFGLPAFDRIEPDHFVPAFERGMAEHQADIDAILADPNPPSFDTVIVPLERMGALLRRVNGTFWNLAGSHTNDALQAVEREIAPRLARHYQAVSANAALFRLVEAVWAERGSLSLDVEQARVLDLTYQGFVRDGATLAEADKQRLGTLVERLAVLGTRFSQNVLADEKSFGLTLAAPADLAGLPPAVVDACARAAVERGAPGGHVVTLSRSIVVPFLQYSTRRDLRETVYAAWMARGENGGDTDNRTIVAETVRLRAERARLLGFETFADFKLQPLMAKTPEAVQELLDRVWERALLRATEEAADLQRAIKQEGGSFTLAAHDWRHYAEKVRKARYDVDEAEVKPYLELGNIMAAAFDTASRLFGLTFTERHDLALYHPDVRAFAVADRAGRHVALFLGDYFARPSKRSGAWNSSFRSQDHMGAEDVRPIVVNVMNFAQGGDGAPTLLSIDDARTLFHEFGHALHTMLSDVTYPSIAGTGVPRDFVEFPSQLYEHWFMREEVLGRFARHAETGAPMPEDLIARVKRAQNFNQGFSTVEYCASAIVDLDFHLLRDDEVTEHFDPLAFERRVLERIGMPPAIAMRHRTPHFSHVFSGDGYSAGYYSYLWSEVLDADGFGAFEEAGDIYDPETADRLYRYVLSAGDTREPDEAYRLFRGRMPSVDTLLEKRGLA
ncbi:M3 family metallopeptidase [Lichenihabitans sp. Uapishka_5]|uniref:M3 family metallopeptidase n=1 Tax=Lichenihabitans sp. Uapishka_5 TaxID=3037302 RepID=UPI0029E8279A|nr:M3 family metallopeptidase [Lichenihabitans sp. Uapishka_5]MDX7952903.1 M3 family metallopeptidase [Lichenihabitans sp. Uapishka_5]